MWVLKVKVISWPWPKVIYIWKLKLAFLINGWAILNQILFFAWPKYQVSISQDHWSSGLVFLLKKAHKKLYEITVHRHFHKHGSSIKAFDGFFFAENNTYAGQTVWMHMRICSFAVCINNKSSSYDSVHMMAISE